jgi:hypothetical protein
MSECLVHLICMCFFRGSSKSQCRLDHGCPTWDIQDAAFNIDTFMADELFV